MLVQTLPTAELLALVPSFAPSYQAFLAETEGEILFHPLLWDLFSFTRRAHSAGDTSTVQAVMRYINLLADHPAAYVMEAVHVSFLEPLTGDPLLLEACRPHLNASAQAMLSDILAWRPEA
jgi:hypothetical protein